jgi:hypothetical protein
MQQRLKNTKAPFKAIPRSHIQNFQGYIPVLLPPGRKFPIPLNLHSHRERGEATVLGIHIHGNSTQSIELLQMALRTRGTTDIIQPPKDLEHSGKRNGAHFDTEALVRTPAEVSV